MSPGTDDLGADRDDDRCIEEKAPLPEQEGLNDEKAAEKRHQIRAGGPDRERGWLCGYRLV